MDPTLDRESAEGIKGEKTLLFQDFSPLSPAPLSGDLVKGLLMPLLIAISPSPLCSLSLLPRPFNCAMENQSGPAQ